MTGFLCDSRERALCGQRTLVHHMVPLTVLRCATNIRAFSHPISDLSATNDRAVQKIMSGQTLSVFLFLVVPIELGRSRADTAPEQRRIIAISFSRTKSNSQNIIKLSGI